jgi:tRNA threonylcarbamoyladenosine modification (KEOPS) complex Cgi121 subunit
MSYSISGARGRITDPKETIRQAQDWGGPRGIDVLLADATVVFGGAHVDSAIRHALRAHDAGTMVAHSVSMEALRYLSAQRQVADAIRIAGIRTGTREVAVAVFGADSTEELLNHFGWARDDTILEPREKSLAALGFTKEALATVPRDRRSDLALEKVALLDVLK